MSVVPTLPEELILEILYKATPASVVTCTAVCKSWNQLIRDPAFISKHFHTSLSNKEESRSRVLMLGGQWKRKKTHLFEHEYLKDFLVLNSPSVKFAAVCNGLVCLIDQYCTSNGYKCILWNPSIRKYYKLPPSALPMITTNRSLFEIAFGFDSSTRSFYDIAFAFDSSTGDFKVLRFRSTVFLSNYPITDYSRQVEVYSLNDDSWKIIFSATSGTESTDDLIRYTELRSEGCCVNGCLHWIAESWGPVACKGFLLVFNLKREVFHKIALPPSASGWRSWHIEAPGESSSLAVIQEERCRMKYNVWVMKEYGVADSWTKMCSFDRSGAMPTKALEFKNGELLFQPRIGVSLILDLDAPKAYEPPKGLRLDNIFVQKFTPSLVLIDKGDDESTWCIWDYVRRNFQIVIGTTVSSS